jgi:two-component sensor histidine kinase
MAQGRDENLEIVQYRKDGTAFRAMLFASPLDDGQGKVLHHFLSYLDVTRRHRAEEDLRALTQELEAKVAERTRELEQANSVLAGLLRERDTLLAEVNHRAKNSLSIASSLLAIQSRRLSDPAIQALFEEARDRIMAMSRVHDLLSKSETSQRVNLRTYLGDLCAALRPITEHDSCVKLTSDVDDEILVDAETAIPLGIIATELITNAVKYAFPPPDCGTIAVRAFRPEPGFVSLIISDDGRGMSKPREGSLGYGLVAVLVRQLGGEMHVSGEDGVKVTIRFPSPH